MKDKTFSRVSRKMTVKSFITYTIHKILLGWQNQWWEWQVILKEWETGNAWLDVPHVYKNINNSSMRPDAV